MQLRHLSTDRRVRQHAFDRSHHAVDITSLLEEAEFLCESYLPNDVECCSSTVSYTSLTPSSQDGPLTIILQFKDCHTNERVDG